MSEQQSSYRQIFKATSIFGGVQVFQIIIRIIKSKIIAVLLGPEGMGIQALLTSTTDLIKGITNFGLGTSAVKNVASANNSGDKDRVATVIIVLRRLVWATGLLGALVTLAFSAYLSELTFGNKNYTLGFAWLSVTLLINQLSTGQIVLLRGLRKIKHLANSSLTGSVLGLMVSIPLYYFYGIDGIVPAIILTSIVTLLRTWYFARKIEIEEVHVDTQTTLAVGKEMMIMGFMLSISGLYVIAKKYGLRIFISNVSDIEQVGLYSAGMAIVTTYVGMVFTAMGTDYFPRLSGVAHDNAKARELINQQAEIAILILAPILTVFIVFISWIIILLYSTRFLDITQMVQWAALGMMFKAVSWSMAFIFLAKGASKLFLANELIGGTVTFIFHLLGYYWGELTGLGIGFLLGYAYYNAQVYFLTRKKYNYNFSQKLMKLFLIQMLLLIACLLIVMFVPDPWSYFLGLLFIATSSTLTMLELNKRLELKQLWQKIKTKKNGRS